MFDATAPYYDLVYGAFKDYASESAQLAGLLRRLMPECRTVLDVACGTGEHARILATQHGFQVDGLDIEAGLLEQARNKLPAACFYEADMCGFHLPNRYHAVTCLFSSIAYVRTLDRVAQALRCMREHLEPRGMVVLEPWFPPGAMLDGHLSRRARTLRGVRIVRSGRTELRDGLSQLHFDTSISDRNGERRISEVHELGLFRIDELLTAFAAAGLEARHETWGLTGRGLIVARTPK